MEQSDNEILQMYFSEIKANKVLDSETQKELVCKAQAGDEQAKETLITSNFRFVISLVKQYKNTRLNISELISEGNIGLMTAIEKYDVTQNVSFISYASWWIRHFILRSIQQSGNLVRLPMSKVRLITQIMQEQHHLMSTDDMPQQLAMTKASELYNISANEIARLVNNSKHTFSLDQEIYKTQENINTFLDTIEDENAESIESQIEHEDTFEILEIFLSRLPQREAEIIRKRFGIQGEQPKSLQALSKEYGITKERVRQLERKAIQRLQKMRKKSENTLYNNLRAA